MLPVSPPRTGLPDLPSLPPEAVEHGEVYTRRWVVELILDLVGYTPDRDLCDLKLVEPACGEGAFLDVNSARVSASCRVHQRPLTDAADAVRAFDLANDSVTHSRDRIEREFQAEGWNREDARSTATR